MTFTIARPAADEYASFYAPYIAALPEWDILAYLERQRAEVVTLLRSIPEERGTFRYQPGKWSIVDVINHMCDAERIFSVRALRIARGDTTPLPGWDENNYAAMAGADGRSPEELAHEFDMVRRATITLCQSLDPEAVVRRGTANNYPISVRALIYIMAGHVQHHVNILGERYGVGK
jgi:hypothetical protein